MIDPNGTPDPEPAETLHDQISSAYDELSGAEPAPQAPQAPPQPEIEAPAHWPEADRQRFQQAPPEWRQWHLDRYKSTEADYTRKTQELAAQRKQAEGEYQYAQQVRQLYEPLKQYGWDERTTAQWAHALATNPAATLAELQKLYGGQTAQPQQNEFFDPVAQQLQQEVLGLRQWQQQQQSMQQQYLAQLREAAQTQEIDSYWNQWASQKDEKGQPKFAHFQNEEVRQTMGALLSNFPDKYTEDQAYALAVQAHVQQAPQSNPQRIADAKRAAFSVQSGSPAPKQIRTSREAIEAAWDQLSNQ